MKRKRLIAALAASICLCVSLTACFHEHTWAEATCTEPKTCTECGETEGKPLGHEEGDWSEWENDYDNLTRSRTLSCKRCGEVIDSEAEDITSLVSDGSFEIHPSGFADRFDDSFGKINGYSFYSKEVYNENMLFYDEDNTVYYEIQDEDNGYSAVGMYVFKRKDGSSVPISQSYSTGCAAEIDFLIEDASDVSPALFAAIMAIDPGLSYDESAELGQSIVDNAGDMEGVVRNSIRYVLYQDGNYHHIVISAE